MTLFRRSKPPAKPPGFKPETASVYETRLAVIGQRLDAEHFRSVCVLEIAGNYIVRALDDGGLTLMEFVAEDFEAVDLSRAPRESQATTWLPGGYQATLRSVGRLLDNRTAAAIAVIEGPSALQILGYNVGHAGGQLAQLPFEITLDEWDLRALGD